jgi:hypothetical protein
MGQLAYHPDGSRLAVALPGAVVVRDATNGGEAIRLSGLSDPPEGAAAPTQLAFSPDGRRLAAGDWAGGVLVHEAIAIDRAEERAAAVRRAFAWHLGRVQAGGPDAYPLAYHAAWLDRLDPPGPWYRRERGRVRARQGRRQPARADLEAAGAAREPADDLALAGLLVLAGDGSGLEKLAAGWPERADPARLLARLLPEGGTDPGLLHQARALGGRRGPAAALAVALALVRAGRPAEASKALGGLKTRTGPGWLVLGLAARQQGNREKARACLAEADRWAAARRGEDVPGVGSAPAAVAADEWVCFHALRPQLAAE